MPKVVLVNPALATVGYSFITPRWLFVVAQATPPEFGDPILIDEALEAFSPEQLNTGDIVGIGITSGNCLAGYRVLRQAKSKGATVIVGGIHATIFPKEPLEQGADAVVTGGADLAWAEVVRDATCGKLRKLYIGGRVPGEFLQRARWSLLDVRKYLLPTVQTLAGCPENCSFCSVWVTEGRQPRLRLSSKVIEEANELHSLGFRYIVFADDNFNPATIGRIMREKSPAKRKELERIRQERLDFFDEYHRNVPENLYAFTQMTAEVASDEEYLGAMHDKMRIRTALVGVDSFDVSGLAAANKEWNPAGEAMIETIRKIQSRGILILSSIICGLETDTKDTLRAMSEFAVRSGSILAQFTIYAVLPGTKDFHEMVSDRLHRGQPEYHPKHRTELIHNRFWLRPEPPVNLIRHPNLTAEELLAANQRCWRHFYSLQAILGRARGPIAGSWPLAGRITYVILSLVFNRVYAGHGMTADCVRRKRSMFTRILIRAGAGIYSHFFRTKRVGIAVPLGPRTPRAG